ncbi:MAG: hypothetical protein KKE08_10080, partial [Gammaproteobacteria bacterium]|nr:hypothetical protein [Gammaproteobacteria bacterium]MBU2203147.1 hypothetical protein [Gammaproteobacteria bacterium]
RFTAFITTVKRGRHFSDLNFRVKRLFKRFLQLSFYHPKPANRSTPWHGAHYRAFLNRRKRLFKKTCVFKIVSRKMQRKALF